MAYNRDYDGNDPNQDPPEQTPPVKDAGHESLNDAVANIYQTALGRAPESDDVVNQWIQGSGGDLAKIQQGIYGTPEAQAYSQAQTAKGQEAAPAPTDTPAPTSTPSTPGMPDGIDPHLAAVYQKAGVTPGGQGSGFADWQYWQNNALKNAGGDWDYITRRLAADLAGTGTDQPTGTPGSGPWSNSGADDRAMWAKQGQDGTLPQSAPFQPKLTLTTTPQVPQGAPTNGLPDPRITYGPNMNNGGNFWQGRTPMDFSSQQTAPDPLRDQSTDLIKALVARLKLGGNGVNFNK